MDTQDKFIVYKQFRKEEILLSDIKQGDIIFKFKEFESIKIENKSKWVIKCEFPNQENLYRITPGEIIELTDYDYNRSEDENNIFFPENYLIQIEYNDNIKECFFKVESNALGENIEDIRKIINDFSKGLEFDLLKSYHGKKYIDAEKNIYMPLFEKIINNEKMLQFELNYIIDDPIQNIENTVLYTRNPTKESRKKIKKNQKKGINENDNRKKVTEKKVLSLNTDANVVLNNCLFKIIKSCSDLEYYFLNNIKYLEEKGIILNKEFLISEKKYEGLKNSFDDKYKNSIRSEYFNLKDTIKKIEAEKNFFIQKQKKVSKIKNNLINQKNESWINDVKVDFMIKDSFSARRNIHYKKIIDFVRYLNTEYNNNFNRSGIYTYKKTSELYEIYVLILVFKIILNQEYNFIMDENYDFNVVFDNEEFIFEKNNLKIKVLYNKLIKRTRDGFKDQLVTQNSSSNRPDIIIMVYENNKFLHSVILEVKCRKKANIYSINGDTPVVAQLQDYSNFWYFDNNLKLQRDPVKIVYAIYPSEKAEKEFTDKTESIMLLSIEPIYDYNKSKGFQNLTEELKKYL